MKDEMLDLVLAVIIFALAISLGYSMVMDGYKQTKEDAEIVLEDKNTSKLESSDYESQFGNHYYDVVDSGQQAIMMIIVQNKMMYGPKKLFVGNKIYEINDSIEDNLTAYVKSTNESFRYLEDCIRNGTPNDVSNELNYNTYKAQLAGSSTDADILKYETLVYRCNQITMDKDLLEYFEDIDNKSEIRTSWQSKIAFASSKYISKSTIDYNGEKYQIKVKYILTIEDKLKTAIGETEGCHVVKAMYYLDNINK